GSLGDAELEARRRIMDRELNAMRLAITHDFDARFPPPLKCCAPGCDRTFTEDSHYREHWAGLQKVDTVAAPLSSRQPLVEGARGDGKMLVKPKSQIGTGLVQLPVSSLESGSRSEFCLSKAKPCAHKDVPAVTEEGHPELGFVEVAAFHLAVTDTQTGGAEAVTTYILREWGAGSALHTLLFWEAVDLWRCHLQGGLGSNFVLDALQMYKTYLCLHAPRAATLSQLTRQGLCRDLGEAQSIVDQSGIVDGKSLQVQGQEIAGHSPGMVGEGMRHKHTGAGVGVVAGQRSVTTGKTQVRRRRSDVVTGELTWESLYVTSGGGGNKGDEVSTREPKWRRDKADGKMKSIIRPGMFDQAQWEALQHLSVAVGSGFWASDLGQQYALIYMREVERKRLAATMSYKMERRDRLLNEARE
ncbi:unnamed protein product, partial [Choristocarpus tenellus]